MIKLQNWQRPIFKKVYCAISLSANTRGNIIGLTYTPETEISQVTYIAINQ